MTTASSTRTQLNEVRSSDNWATTKLRFLLEVNPTTPAELRNQSDRLVPFIPMEALGEDGSIDTTRERPVGELLAGYSYFANGDVLMAKVTPCFENGKAALVQSLSLKHGFGSTEITTLRASEGLDPAFLYYLVRSDHFRQASIASMTGAGGLKRVPDEHIRSFETSVPPETEQRTITNFLDRETAKIDALIDKQEQLIATLREDRAATINQAVTKGLESNVETKASGVTWLGEIPTHWIAARLKNVISAIDSGTSVNGADVPALPGEPGVLKTSCVSTGQFRPEANKTVFGEEVDRLSCPVTVGTLLVNRANTPALVGSAGFVHDPHPNLYLSDKIWQVSFTDSLAEFIYFWTQTNVYRSQITGNSVGASSSMQNLSMSDFKNTAIALPPISDQRAIVQFLSVRIRKIDALIDKSTEMIEMLREYRSALITNAVTGKIDVREAV